MKIEIDIDKARILLRRDPIIREVFASSKAETYLVGGMIRDTLQYGTRGRGPRDYDFITENSPLALVKAIRNKLGGSIVMLRQESIVRLVLKNSHVIDVSTIVSSTEEDLKSRDFSVNSIAWSPDRGFINPTGGIKDLSAGRIVHISERNILSDPLRILRAYRFASCNGLSIAANTRKLNNKHKIKLSKPASERITYEIFRLLTGRNALCALKLACDDGILSVLLGIPSKIISKNISGIGRLLKEEEKIPSSWRDRAAGMGLNNFQALLLNQLLQGADLSKLSLPTNFQKRTELTGKGLSKAKKLTPRKADDIYALLISFKETTYDVAYLSGMPWLVTEFRRLKRIQSSPLITAQELISYYQIPEGPKIGDLLKKVEQLRFTREAKKKCQLIKLFSLNS